MRIDCNFKIHSNQKGEIKQTIAEPKPNCRRTWELLYKCQRQRELELRSYNNVLLNQNKEIPTSKHRFKAKDTVNY